jgi:hypothetical protein
MLEGMLNLLLCLSILASAADPVPFKKGKVVSEAVAQAAGHVVTSREVQISYALAQAMSEQSLPLKEKKKTSDWVLKPGEEAFKQHLAQILLEMVVNKEAENFSIGEVDGQEIAKAEKQAKDVLKDWNFWQALEVAPSELNQMIIIKLRARNFLKFKSETSGVQISDDEAKEYYEKNRVKFGNLPFSQFKENIKDVLAQELLQEKLKDWFDILKRKYRVKVLGVL